MIQFKIIYVLSVTFCLLSCNNYTQPIIVSDCDSTIDSIIGFYYNYAFNSVKAKKCEDLYIGEFPDFINNDEGVLAISITECKVLKEIQEEISRLTPSKEDFVLDARIAFQIYYKNQPSDELCISGDIIFKNHKPQQSNNRLLFLLKNNIGYYYWFTGLSLDYMAELKDSSFQKEPFIQDKYYKKYLEMPEENKSENKYKTTR